MTEYLKPAMLAVAMTVLTLLIVICVCDTIVISNARGRVVEHSEDLAPARTGLLLGTSPLVPGRKPNMSYRRRVEAAARLYNEGRINRIVASGADYSALGGCNEPDSMCRDLMAAGVPRRDITLDYDGRRTILSIVNALDKYGLDSVIIISQKYHCERALMQADHFGLRAVGFAADDPDDFSALLRNFVRERLARVKLMLDLMRAPDRRDS